MAHKVEITTGKTGAQARVFLDDVDITSALRGVKFEVSHDTAAKVYFTLIPDQALLNCEAQVYKAVKGLRTEVEVDLISIVEELLAEGRKFGMESTRRDEIEQFVKSL